jgi:hypothetical protein
LNVSPPHPPPFSLPSCNPESLPNVGRTGGQPIVVHCLPMQQAEGSTPQLHNPWGILPEPTGVLDTSEMYCATPALPIVPPPHRHIADKQ